MIDFYNVVELNNKSFEDIVGTDEASKQDSHNDSKENSEYCLRNRFESNLMFVFSIFLAGGEANNIHL